MPATQQKDGTWRIKKKDGTLGTRKFTSKKNALAAQRGGGAKKPAKKGGKKSTSKAVATSGSSAPGTGKTYQGIRLTAMALAPATDEMIAIVAEGKDVRQAGEDLWNKAKSRPHLTHLGIVAADVIVDRSRKVGQAAAMSRGSVTAWAPEVYTVALGVIQASQGTSERDIHRGFHRRTTGYDPTTNKTVLKNARTYRMIKHGGQLIRIGAGRVKVLRKLKSIVQENILRPVGATL